MMGNLKTESEAATGCEASVVERLVMGPPAPGPVVNIQAPGIYLHLQVNDQIDLEKLRLVILRAEQRRYAKAV